MAGAEKQLSGGTVYGWGPRIHPVPGVALALLGLWLIADWSMEGSIVRPRFVAALDAVIPAFDERHRGYMEQIEDAIAVARASKVMDDEGAAVQRFASEFEALGWQRLHMQQSALSAGEPEWRTWVWRRNEVEPWSPWVGLGRNADGSLIITMNAGLSNSGRGDKATFVLISAAEAKRAD